MHATALADERGTVLRGDRLFSAVVRLFAPGYAAHLVDDWLPALDGWSKVATVKNFPGEGYDLVCLVATLCMTWVTHLLRTLR